MDILDLLWLEVRHKLAMTTASGALYLDLVLRALAVAKECPER
jgi:hypothetical protein